MYAAATINHWLSELPAITSGRVERPRRGLYRLKADVGDKGRAAQIGSSSLPASKFAVPPKPLGKPDVTKRVRASALDALKSSPDAMRYSDLKRCLADRVPDASNDVLGREITDLPRLFPSEVERAGPGLYRYRLSTTSNSETPPAAKVRKQRVAERDFYASFADWLMRDTDDCTKAVPLGGSKFGGKWGTPDVVGVRKIDLWGGSAFPVEIVSAEVKLDTGDLIVAFGQACAYRLFSHKTYLVIPKASPPEDKARLDSLCIALGIGLVLFNSTDPNRPDYEIRTRPARHLPDNFYVERYLSDVKGLL
jgi:hypothetical protein